MCKNASQCTISISNIFWEWPLPRRSSDSSSFQNVDGGSVYQQACDGYVVQIWSPRLDELLKQLPSSVFLPVDVLLFHIVIRLVTDSV